MFRPYLTLYSFQWQSSCCPGWPTTPSFPVAVKLLPQLAHHSLISSGSQVVAPVGPPLPHFQWQSSCCPGWSTTPSFPVAVKLLPRLAHHSLISSGSLVVAPVGPPLPHFHRVFKNCWTSSHTEYSWNTSPWMLNNNQSITDLVIVRIYFFEKGLFLRNILLLIITYDVYSNTVIIKTWVPTSVILILA